MVLTSINYIAIILATVLSTGTAMVWYSDKMFGKVWRKEAKISEHDMASMKGKKLQKAFTIQVISVLIATISLAVLFEFTAAATFTEAIYYGVFMWLGFTAAFATSPIIWQNQSWVVFAIEQSFNLVQILIGVVIIIGWEIFL
jgi:hypothetical protein